ncbi:uncharacterized protein N7473_001747 [Penicillium subrubescens]|uniref:uncharacterized protein n=1 Tax=Penicillium subrubescens TaxID=1316194 RepID=UPI002545AEF1|nr:uncharacterized protein N7473_001747 [Penicillium subrubescens]KAJ5904831.1 hypothetical protein N7473_001747 [Penicillium subrubescens]
MAYTITAVFPNNADAKYDIDYYARKHMPLIEKRWSQYGLKNYEVFWENEEGMKKAFESATVAEIMADVPRFSNKPPIFLVGQIIKPASML